jgi:hypothetical protein
MDGTGQPHNPVVLLSPGKEPRYPINKKLGGLWSRSGCFREGQNFLPQLEFELRIVQLVA